MNKKVEVKLIDMVESNIYHIYTDALGVKCIFFLGYYNRTDSSAEWKQELGAPRYACYTEEDGIEMPLRQFIDKYHRNWNEMWNDGWDGVDCYTDGLTYRAYLTSVKGIRNEYSHLDLDQLTYDTPDGEYYDVYRQE